MAGGPEGLAAPQHGPWRSRSSGRRRNVETHPPRAACRLSRTGRPRGQPDRLCHRLPEREERREWVASIDPGGCDVGKRIEGRKRRIPPLACGACRCRPSFIRPMSEIATAASRSWRRCSAFLPSCSSGMPMVAIEGQWFGPDCAVYVEPSRSRSSNGPLSPGASSLPRAMDRRTHHRWADPSPTPGEGPGMPDTRSARVSAAAIHPDRGAKAPSNAEMISARL